MNLLSAATNLLFDYLVVFTVFAVIIVAVAWSLCCVFKIKSALTRHMIWIQSLMVMLLLPIIFLYVPKMRLKILPRQMAVEYPVQKYAHVLSGSDPIANTPTPRIFLQTSAGNSVMTAQAYRDQQSGMFIKIGVCVIWLLGFCTMSLRLVYGFYRLQKLKASSIPMPRSSYYNVPANVQLFVSETLTSPINYGALRPCIFIPKNIISRNTARQLQMVLHHEIAHVYRKDYFANLFQRILEAMFFFHPLVWFASWQLTREREQICDNYVLAKGTSAREYAGLLAQIVERQFQPDHFEAVALFEGKLLERVRNILDQDRPVETSTPKLAVLLSVAAFILFGAIGSIRLDAQVIPSSQPTQNSASALPDAAEKDSSLISGNCEFTGTVIMEQTGYPIKNAKINIHELASWRRFTTYSNDLGQFAFSSLPAGEYMLNVRAGGFQSLRNSTAAVSKFVLSEQKPLSMTLPLKNGYTVSGTVLSSTGVPPINFKDYSVVAVIAATDTPQELKVAARAELDSDGSYIIEGLSDKPVYVMVDPYDSDTQTHASPVYYPGTNQLQAATVVSFNGQTSVPNINIKMPDSIVPILSGSVFDNVTGQPVSNAFVIVHRKINPNAMINTYTNSQGQFKIPGLDKGEYLVHIDAAVQGYTMCRQSIIVEDNQLQLNFSLTRGVSISGRFVDENGITVDVINPYGSAEIMGTSPDVQRSYEFSEQFGTNPEKRIRLFDGQGDYFLSGMYFPTKNSFLVHGIAAGKTKLFFFQNKYFKVSKVLYGGVDVSESGFETRPGQIIEGVLIVVANNQHVEKL